MSDDMVNALHRLQDKDNTDTIFGPAGTVPAQKNSRLGRGSFGEQKNFPCQGYIGHHGRSRSRLGWSTILRTCS